MKSVIKQKNEYFLRLDKGEEILATIKQFCLKENIRSGFFTGIGVIDRLMLSYYDIHEKKYSDKLITKELEITNITGDVSQFLKDTIIHVHGNFSDDKYQVIGGHVKEAVVSATCEIYLRTFNSPMKRKRDEPTGLNLLE